MNPKRYPVQVTIVQPSLEPYRINFYLKLLSELGEKYNLKLVINVKPETPNGSESPYLSSLISICSYVREFSLSIGTLKVSLRPTRKIYQKSDLIIMELQASKIDNVFASIFLGKKIVLWGHAVHKEKKGIIIEKTVERIMCLRARHILVYTEEGKEYLVSKGINPSKITVLQNAIDSKEIRRLKIEISQGDKERIREKYKLSKDDRAILYLGNFSETKRLHFLISAMKWLEQHSSNYRLLVGSAKCPIQLKELSNVVFLGYLSASEKAEVSEIVESIWMPGRIGLVAVDALAMNLPIYSTENQLHAPEISYLKVNENLFFLPDEPTSFAKTYITNEVSKLDIDIEQVPSVETMVHYFAQAIYFCTRN